jgi:hypothetical protein
MAMVIASSESKASSPAFSALFAPSLSAMQP